MLSAINEQLIKCITFNKHEDSHLPDTNELNKYCTSLVLILQNKNCSVINNRELFDEIKSINNLFSENVSTSLEILNKT
jgi:hypothetical protein